jgi:hypothetical protein
VTTDPPAAAPTASPSLVPTASPSATYTGTSWSSTALSVEERLGERFIYHCPPGGAVGVVWGTDTYTTDSSVCTAAVHFGLIGLDAGGEAVIQIQPGLAAYTGSDRNGVSTIGYTAYDSSFDFVTSMATSPPGSPVVTGVPPSPVSPSTGTAAYVELLTYIPPAIAATCREIDTAAAGALAAASCAADDAIVAPDVAISEVAYVRYAEVSGARIALQDRVEAYGESLGEDCAAGPAQVLNDLGGEVVGRLVCLDDREHGGTVVSWWTDERLNLLGSVVLLEGDIGDLLNVVAVAQAQP